jgi:hypothetical protein
MFTRLRRLLAAITCSLITATGLATGVFAACNGNYCLFDTTGCTPLHQPFQDSCCRNSGNGVYRCYTCWRDYWWCDQIPWPGPAYNCSGAGATCS